MSWYLGPGTYNYDYFADFDFTKKKKEISLTHFSIQQIPTCSKCGQTLQEKTDHSPKISIHKVQRATKSDRKKYQIPNQLKHYIFDWHLLGFRYPQCGLGNFFFIPNEELANSSLCDGCLRKTLKGKTVKVFSLNDKNWHKFKIK